jgi:hypothetical protein
VRDRTGSLARRREGHRGGGNGRKPLASADAAKGMRALGMHAEGDRKPLASADAAKGDSAKGDAR